MKKSSLILLVVGFVFILCLVGSNLVLKNQYNQIDKGDPFWNYTKLAKGNFHHIRMTGANFTRASFIPGPGGSVGVLNYWEQPMKKRIQTSISNDTLFIRGEENADQPGLRDWMKYHVLIAISCPDLISVEAVNSNLEIYRFKQKNLFVQLSGKSKMEVESFITDFDSISVIQRDTSSLKFEMADEIPGSGFMHADVLDARLTGHSILDVGHFRLSSLHQSIGDSCGIILSGNSLKAMGIIQ